MCMRTYYIRLEIEAVAKGRPRITRSGHAYTPARTRDYETRLRELLGRERDRLKIDSPLETALYVGINFFLPKPKSGRRVYPTARPDADNYAKAVLDCCNGIFFKDDSQVVDLVVSKRYVQAGELPYIQLAVIEIEE